MKRIKESQVLIKNENETNSIVAKVLPFLSVFLILFDVLVWMQLFGDKFDPPSLTIPFAAMIIALFVPFVLNRLNIVGWWVKYFNITVITLLIAIFYYLCTGDAVILYSLPVVLSCIYFNKRLTIFIAAVSVVIFPYLNYLKSKDPLIDPWTTKVIIILIFSVITFQLAKKCYRLLSSLVGAKEVQDILDNMSQAIFTIDEDFKFNEQYSKFAYDIFGNIQFAERSILDVFFPNEDQKTIRESMAAWLTRVFASLGTKWENLEALQPIREIAIKQKITDLKYNVKYINIDFQPVIDIVGIGQKEEITKIMVIVQDITEKKVLELEMGKKEQEYKDNINQIVEVIKMDQELFQDFINECKESLANFEPTLIALKDDKQNAGYINDLFRIMHTIKGNARIFKLERIAGEAHSIENIFSSIRKGEAVMDDELLSESFKKLDYFNTLFNETLDIYNKITAGKGPDTGETRATERLKDENEVVKVKVLEVNKLTELINNANIILSEDVSKLDPDKLTALENILKETKGQLRSMSKISIGKLFTRFPRMVRDTSIELGKKVKLVIKGDNIEVDKSIYDKISDPLIHILRNSLDHGLEIPADRVQLGKPEEGIIELNTWLTDSELVVEIIDNGRGLDLDKIKAKAVKKGLIAPEAALNMTDSEATELIFLPGFSTNERVTDISGRGVGMDVVKTSIEKNLNGSVHLESQMNKGLRTTLKVPLSNAS
jgi:two-component system, chemotaxis family, sensor kinase CheA